MTTVKLKRNSTAGTVPTVGQLVAGEMAINTEDGYLYAENAANTVVNRIGTTSDRVKFTQSGTGAQDRNVQDKLRETVSVKDFGAVGDGVTDDTAAIQAALSAHDAVFMPAGEYKISGTIFFKSENVLMGTGYSNTKVFRDTSIATFDYFSGITVTGVKVSGIYFDGVAKLPVTDAANRYCALRFWDNNTGNRSKDVVVEDCKFTFFTSAEFQPEGNRGVIAVNRCDDVVVRGCRFEDNRATCVFYTDTKNIRALDNFCLGEQVPYDLDFQPTQGLGSFCSGGSEGSLIMGNRMEQTGFSSINAGGNGSVVANNIIQDPFYSGITINESSAAPAIDVVISGNTISGSVLSGISMFNADKFQIVGNLITNVVGSGNSCIRFFRTNDGLAGCANGHVVGNYFFNELTNQVGIIVNSAENVHIKSNIFDKNSTGVFVKNVSDTAPISIDVTGNTFTDNTNFGVELNADGLSAQKMLVDNNTFISTDIDTLQQTGIVANGAVSTVVIGRNSFSDNYDIRFVETTFGARATKAVLQLSSATVSRLKLWDGINYIRTVSYNPPSLADGAGVTTTVTVPGVDFGDFSEAAFNLSLQGILMTTFVSAANTISVRFQNKTGGTIDLGSGLLTVKGIKV